MQRRCRVAVAGGPQPDFPPAKRQRRAITRDYCVVFVLLLTSQREDQRMRLVSVGQLVLLVTTALFAASCGPPVDNRDLASSDTVTGGDPQAAELDAALSPSTSVGAIDASATADQTADRLTYSWSAVTDSTRIPLGDGKISTSPQVDALMSCQTTFGGRGAPHGGPWIDEANSTWDSTIKLRVLGSNAWSQAFYSESIDGVERVIEFSSLPTDHVTGNFPIDPNDPAYQYDRNPNGIEPKTIELRIPIDPVVATSPGCVPMGPIGVMANGVFIYNALDAAGADAAAHEVQDVCDGHPDGAAAYHYHDVPSCIVDATPDTGGSTLIGYALDGYGIYIERDTRGNLPTNADLDDCHGRSSTVAWNGEEHEIYHYSATLEYPYTVGCFRGTPVPAPRRN